MRTITRKGLPPPEELEAIRLLREKIGYVSVVDTLEKAIVEDIFTRTNWYAERLGGYETTDEEVARDVLPILLEWLPRVADRGNFRAIFHRFCTPQATPYVETLIESYLEEQDNVNQSLLVQALALAARSQHAVRLWQLCQQRVQRDLRILFMVRLSRFSVVAPDIKDELVRLLNGDPPPSLADLREVLSVRDPRIREWFKGKLQTPDTAVRSIARRYVARGAKLPSGVFYAQVLPDRVLEIYSWETDLAQFGPTLVQASRKFNFRIPATIRKGRFLEMADLDRWLVTHVGNENGKDLVSIWFRLEDFDSVEIVLNRQLVEFSN